MLSFKNLRGFILALNILVGAQAFAGPQYLTYEGSLTNTSNAPIAGSVSFDFSIWNPSMTCMLYSEQRTVTATVGNFAAKFGPGSPLAGTQTFPASPLTDFSSIFVNSGTFTGMSSCMYTPATGDSRMLKVQIYDTITLAWVFVDNYELTSATNAFNADRLEGKTANQFLQVPGGASATSLNATQVSKLVDLLSPSTPTTFSNQITFSAAPQFSGTPSSGNDITNKTYVDSAVSTAVSGFVLPNVGTPGTYYKVSTNAKGQVTTGATALAPADIPSLDASQVTMGTFGGVIGINTSGNLYSSGTVTGGTVSATTLKIYNGANFIQISASTMSGNLNWIFPNSNGSAGQVLRTDGAGNLSWVAASAGGVTGVTATSPLAAGTGATPNITITQATTSTAGYLSSTDFNTFNNKLGTSSTFVGDVSGVSGATVVDKLKGAALAINSLTSGNFLKYNGTNWINSILGNSDITAGLGYTPVNRAGDTLSGLLVLSADPSANLGSATKQYVDAVTAASAAAYIRRDGNVAFTGTQSMGSNKLIFVTDPTAAQDAATKNYVDSKVVGKTAAAPAAGQNGQSLRWNSGSLAWEYYTPVTGTGLTNLNGAVGNSQTFANGSSGTTPAFVTASDVHTLNIPMANTTSVTAGLISKTEFDTFNTKLSTSSTFAGDVSGLYNALSVDKLKNAPLSITSLTSGNFLKYNGTNWVNTNLVNADITTGLGFAPVNKAGDTMTGAMISTAGTAAAPSVGVGANTLGLFNGGTNILGLSTAGTERMRIDASGNVGIGTSAPTGKLEIVETLTATQDRGFVSTQVSNDAGAARLTFRKARAFSGPGAQISPGDNLGSITAFGHDGTSYGTKPSAVINLTATESFTTSNRGSSIIFYTKTTGTADAVDPTERMRIDQSGNVILSGNVGIGTSTPGAALDVFGQVKISGGLPAAGKVLTAVDATGLASWASPAVGGSVTNVSSINSDIGVASSSTAPVLTLNSGTAGGVSDANKIAKLNAVGVLNSNMIPNIPAANITGTMGVAQGGTGLSTGTPGGIPFYSASGTMASSAILTSNGVVLGGGAGFSPTSTGAGGADSVLRVPAGGGPPVFGAIDLTKTAAVSGVLPIGSGGTGSSTQNFVDTVNTQTIAGQKTWSNNAIFSANVGIGTVAPTAALDVSGHIANSQIALTGTSLTCGTGASITGNDTRGLVTLGSSGVTLCVVTFSSVFSPSPYCVITPVSNLGTTSYWVTSNTSSFTVNFSATQISKQFNYICLQ